jgi:hypothetical protein
VIREAREEIGEELKIDKAKRKHLAEMGVAPQTLRREVVRVPNASKPDQCVVCEAREELKAKRKYCRSRCQFASNCLPTLSREVVKVPKV